MQKKSLVIDGCSGKSILIDFTYNKNKTPKKVIIFSHGFKGFKDWGPFNKIAEHFAINGFFFVKFNFSYNGTTISKPNDFDDLDAFGNNNLCKELDDLGLVLDWLLSSEVLKEEIEKKSITLFGHSRGGAVSILKSAEDHRISSVVSWAAPSNLLNRLPSGDKAKIWEETNVAYVYNGRTNQNMPMYYQFYENCIANLKRLNIENVVSNMQVPHLHIHGNNDPTVLIDEAYNIKRWNSNTKLYIIDKGNHVFDGFHPYSLEKFPKHLQTAIDITIDFLEG